MPFYCCSTVSRVTKSVKSAMVFSEVIEMNNKKIGSFISDLRKEQSLSQKELAEKLMVTDKAVSKWETGRGLPDVSLLQPLSDALGITVSELLNGERLEVKDNESDKNIIKKLKIKKYIRLSVEVVISFIFAYWVYIFFDTFKLFNNVLDINLHFREISFLSICSLLFIVAFIIWIITVIVSGVLKRKATVIKTIIICLSFCFVVGASIKMAELEDDRNIQIYDTPIDTVEYLKYDDFFDDKFETQITLGETNDVITKNYSAYFESEDGMFANTMCVETNDEELTKRYFVQRKPSSDVIDMYTVMNSSLCEKYGVTAGYYIEKHYNDNDVSLFIIKGNAYYELGLSDSNINDERLIEAVRHLPD